MHIADYCRREDINISQVENSPEPTDSTQDGEQLDPLYRRISVFHRFPFFLRFCERHDNQDINTNIQKYYVLNIGSGACLSISDCLSILCCS